MSEDTNTTPTVEEAQITTPLQTEVKPEDSKDFKALRTAFKQQAKELSELKNAQEESIQAKLKEEGKYKELLESEIKKREELEASLKNQSKSKALENELRKAGINSDLLDLILESKQGSVELDENNEPTNVIELVNTLKLERPALFIETQKRVGDIGTNIVTSNSNGNLLSSEEAQRIVATGNAVLIAQHAEQIKKQFSN